MKRLLLGLALVFALSASAVAQQKPYVKIATWNMEWLTDRTSGIPTNVKPKSVAGLKLLRGYAKELDADIIAFQEVDGEKMLAEVLDPAVYDFHITDETDVQRPGFAIRKGVSFTRNPDLAELDVTAGAARSLRRGADITVTLFGQPVRMLAVHLKCCCPVGDLDQPGNQNCSELAKQVPVLKGWVDMRTKEGAAFIVLGDFNRQFNARPVSNGKLVVDDMWRDLNKGSTALHRVTDGLQSKCWGGKHAQFIDHIVLNPAAKKLEMPKSVDVLVYRETDESYQSSISDHCPISVKLRKAS